MKNDAIKKMLAKQHLVPEEDITIEFIAVINNIYEFKATVLNNSNSVASGWPYREELKITVKSEPWINDF